MEDCLIAAILQCRVAEAYLILESMRAENLARMARGEPSLYGREAFIEVINETGIHHNAIHSLIKGC